jgi:hypothetical protein
MNEFLPPDDPLRLSKPSVPPLTMTTEDGKLYTRSPEVTEDIGESLCWTIAILLARYTSLLNEALVFNIRRFRGQDEHICGLLLEELAKRVTRIVKATIRGRDPLAKADIAMQIEMEILELAIAPVPSRKSEILEVAFTHAVKRRAINLRKQLKGTVQGNRGRYKPLQDLDEEEKNRKRPLEFAPDGRNSPEAALVAFQDERCRDQAYQIAMEELEGEDERLPLMFRLVVVDGWTVWSANPDVPTVARHFGLTRGQTRYLMEKIDNIIAAVGDAYRAGKKSAVTGGQR